MGIQVPSWLKWGFSVMCIAAFIAYLTNPDLDSFRTFCHRQIERQNGSFAALLTNVNLWMSQRTGSVLATNYYLFTYVTMPRTYLATLLDDASTRECPFIGIFWTWIPLCLNFGTPECIDVGNCHGRGICVATNTCMCLPSWKSDGCKYALPRFAKIFTNPILLRVVPGLEAISWLELFAIAFIVVYVYLLIAPMRRPWFISAYYYVVDQKQYYALITSQFRHGNLLHLVNNLYGYYAYAPFVYGIIGAGNFIHMFLATAIISNGISLIVQRIRRVYTIRALGASALVVALKAFFILTTVAWNDVVLRSLAQVMMSQLLLDFIFLGDAVDIAGHFGGLATGYLFYRYLQH